MKNLTTFEDHLNEKLSGVHKASGSKEYNKLVKILQQAVEQAVIVGEDAEDNPENYEGSEGSDISIFLEQIWSGFSTGDHQDSSRNDEIFK